MEQKHIPRLVFFCLIWFAFTPRLATEHLPLKIYTSADAGKQWHLLYNFGKPRMFVDNIIVDPRNPRVLYVGAHRHNLPGGFFKSTDGGVTWKENAQLKNEALHSLAQSESNPDTLIAGTFTGIFRSDDAGETWKQLPTSNTPGLLHVESLAIDPRTSDDAERQPSNEKSQQKALCNLCAREAERRYKGGI